MIEKNAFSIIFGIFLLFTCHDVFYGQSSRGEVVEPDSTKQVSSNDHLHHHHHHIPSEASSGAAISPDLASTSHVSSIPTIRIQYCHSCGYKQAFDEISRMLATQYPEIKIIGELHQPGWLRSQIVSLLFIIKWSVIGMLYMGINPFTYFQVETPRLWTYISQNKVSTTLFVLFFGNSIDSNLMSTGAFEIFYNDMPVWSKIQTGRMPSAPELLQIVQTHMSLGQRSRIGEFVPT